MCCGCSPVAAAVASAAKPVAKPPAKPVETDNVPAAGDGAGVESLWTRRQFMIHPYGIKWTDTSVAGEFPSNAELRLAEGLAAEALRQVVPENRLRVYDTRAAMQGIADEGSLLMLRTGFGVGIHTALARVAGAGGRVHTPKTALPPGMGFFAHVEDTEGNIVGLHAMA